MKLQRTFLHLTTAMVITASCGLINVAYGTPADALASLRGCTYAQNISHRGMADRRHTENTIRAFSNAVAHGSRNLETDVQLTRDGQWVYMHDYTINRTTRGRGYVARLSLQQIKRVKTNDGRRGGVPVLQQGLAYLRARPSLTMQIEVKSYTASVASLNKLVRYVKAYHVQDRVMFTSFGKTVLYRIRTIDPSLNTGFLSSRAVSINTARLYGENVLIAKRSISPSYVEAMHAAGFRVYAWTVDTYADWNRMVRYDVDGITSDRVPVLNSYCRSARR